MKCTDFENRLNQLLDDRAVPERDALLLAHADQCGDCRELLFAQESLFRGLAVLQRGTVSPELGQRVLGNLETAPTPVVLLPLPPRERRWWPLLAAAAAVLLAVGLSVWFVNRDRNQPEIAEPNKQPVASEGLALIKPGRTHAKPNSQEASQSTDPVKTESVAVNPAPGTLPNEKSEEYRQRMVSLASQWSTNGQWPQVDTLDVGQVEQYAPSIRPIRESFEVALDALLRTIPGMKENRTAPPQALQPYGGPADIA